MEREHIYVDRITGTFDSECKLKTKTQSLNHSVFNQYVMFGKINNFNSNPVYFYLGFTYGIEKGHI